MRPSQVLALDAVISQAETLARGQVFTGNPDEFNVSLSRIRHATAEDLKKRANRWLSDGEYQLEIIPFPQLKADEKGVTGRSCRRSERLCRFAFRSSSG